MTTTFQKWNKFYKNLFKIMFVSLTVIVPMYWAIVNTTIDIFTPLGIYQQYIFQVKHELSMASRAIALGISLIPTLTILYIIRLFIKLFSCYENLEIFSSKVTRIYKSLSVAFILYFFVQLIYSPLISLALSYGNPKGQKFISIEISGIDFLILLFAGILMIIASVMKKAENLKVISPLGFLLD